MSKLVFDMWKELMVSPESHEAKLLSLCAILQVYSALLGMLDEDFDEWAHLIGEMYPGPLPDMYSQEIIDYYESVKKDG